MCLFRLILLPKRGSVGGWGVNLDGGRLMQVDAMGSGYLMPSTAEGVSHPLSLPPFAKGGGHGHVLHIFIKCI